MTFDFLDLKKIKNSKICSHASYYLSTTNLPLRKRPVWTNLYLSTRSIVITVVSLASITWNFTFSLKENVVTKSNVTHDKEFAFYYRFEKKNVFSSELWSDYWFCFLYSVVLPDCLEEIFFKSWNETCLETP